MVAVAGALFGCGSSKVTAQHNYAATASLPKPHRIIVYDFAATADDIAAHADISGHYERRMTRQTAEQVELGRKLGARVAETLVEEIRELNMPAERAGSGPSPSPGDVLIQGEFVSIDKGSRTKRMLLGFGAGAGELQTHVVAYQVTPDGRRLLGETDVKSKGGHMPGMLVPVTAGAAAGQAATSVAISGGMNIMQETGPEGLNAAAKRTAKKITKEVLAPAFARHGWIPPARDK